MVSCTARQEKTPVEESFSPHEVYRVARASGSNPGNGNGGMMLQT